MIKIDVRDKICPLPVIMIKDTIDNNKNFDYIEVLSNSEISVQNIEKMLIQLKYKNEILKINDNEYVIKIFNNYFLDRDINENIIEEKKVNNSDYIVVINSNKMGQGDEKLSEKLLENFIYALSELKNVPKAVILYNSGVFLATDVSKNLEDFVRMKEKGVDILLCGLCIEFYNLKDKYKIGEITNMYNIVDMMTNYRVVKP